jgi:hypothetical protein
MICATVLFWINNYGGYGFSSPDEKKKKNDRTTAAKSYLVL